MKPNSPGCSCCGSARVYVETGDDPQVWSTYDVDVGSPDYAGTRDVYATPDWFWRHRVANAKNVVWMPLGTFGDWAVIRGNHRKREVKTSRRYEGRLGTYNAFGVGPHDEVLVVSGDVATGGLVAEQFARDGTKEWELDLAAADAFTASGKVYSVDCDRAGNWYLAGGYVGGPEPADVAVTGGRGVAKVNADGTLAWYRGLTDLDDEPTYVATDVAVSPDGTTVWALASFGEQVRRFDGDGGRLALVLPEAGAGFEKLRTDELGYVYSHHAAGLETGSLRAYDPDGMLAAEVALKGQYLNFDVDPTGSWVYVLSGSVDDRFDYRVRKIDPWTGEVLHESEPDVYVANANYPLFCRPGPAGIRGRLPEEIPPP